MFNPRTEDLNEIISNLDNELRQLSGATLYLTGAAGFLGRYFLNCIERFNEFNDEKIKVIGVDNFISSGKFGKSLKNYSSSEVILKQSNLSNMSDDDKVDVMGCEYVIHAAGIASPTHYKKNPLATIDVAVSGTRSLLECCKSTKAKFTFFSSSEIYGNPPDEYIPIQETFKGFVSSMGPRACYDESKRLGETLCSVFSNEFGLHTNIIRPFNVYGPGMQSTDYRVMPNFAFRILNNQKLQVYGSGNQTRTYCYVTDAISGFIKVFANGKYGQAYNIGNPSEEISAAELAKKFKHISSRNVEINVIAHPDDYPSDEPDRRCPSIKKAINDLNYSPKVDLSDGIERFLSYIGIECN